MPHSRLHARGDVLLKAYCLPSVFNKLTILVLSDSVPDAEASRQVLVWLLAALRGALSWRVTCALALRRTRRARCTERVARRLQA